MAGLLAAGEIDDALLDPIHKQEWPPIFETRQFAKLPEGKGIYIDPFSPENLGPMSYDLTVGSELFSLRKGERIRLEPGGQPAEVDPGETVLVLTREFLALGPAHAAVTLSRARIMNQGIALSSAKIDPTWYGCLIVPLTNNSRSKAKLLHGQPFCTIPFFRLQAPVAQEHFLSKRNTPHLGQTTLVYHPTDVTPWEPRRPDTVRDEDMDKAVSFGPPFDIVRGMFDYNRREIVDYMEKQWSPAVLEKLKRSLWDEEFRQIKAYRTEEIGLLKEQIQILKDQAAATKTDRRAHLTLAVGVLTMAVGLLGAVAALIWKTLHV